MPIRTTVAQLAQLSGGDFSGNGEHVLTGVANLSEAGPCDVSFLGNPKYAALAAKTKAGCVFLPSSNRDIACGASNRVFVEDPQHAFSLVQGMIAALRPKPPSGVDARAAVHPEARLEAGVSVGVFSVIEKGARIGAGTVISPHCFVGEGVVIGQDCFLHPRVVVREDCVLGDRVILQPGVVLGGDGFGFTTDKKTGKHRKIPQVGNVVIHNDVEIGANTAIDRAAVGSTVVGAGTKIDNLVQLAHGVKTGKDCLIVSQVGVSGSTVLGDRVILAGQAGLVGHLHIGDGAVVMAQAGIMSDLEKGQLVWGTPSRPHRETLKLLALYGKLPEIYETIKEIKKKFGASNAPSDVKTAGKS